MQEHRGLAKVHSVCAEMNSIWRPTGCSDLGIDGQIEFLEIDTVISTGHILAVQLKSGPSYFQHQDETCVKYYPHQNHKSYWKKLNLPVILILHNPYNEMTLYCRVKPQLFTEGQCPLMIKKSDIFHADIRNELVSVAQEDVQFVSPQEISEGLRKAKLYVGDNVIDGVQLLLACSDPVRRLFEFDMGRMHSLLELASEEFGISFGHDTYDFIFRCLLKYLGYKLTESYELELEKSWYEDELIPEIVVPLTEVGLRVLEHINLNLAEDRY